MSKYWAEIGPNKTVLRVVVCETQQWLEKNLGGTWVETDPEHPEESYAGRLMHDSGETAKERFLHVWAQPGPDGYEKGAKVWHISNPWLSLIDKNTYEPGSAGWRDYSEEYPKWIEPTNQYENYLKDERVTYNEQRYLSLINGNSQVPDKSLTAWRPVILP
jgi:hypothetical protein